MIGILLFSFCTLGGPNVGDVSIADVTDGLRLRDEALKNFKINMQIHLTRRSPLTGVVFNYALVDEIRLDRALGRFHSHRHGATLMPPSAFKGNKEYLAVIDQINAFDGERTRNYSRLPAYDAAGNDSGRFIEVGRVYAKRVENWEVNPANLIDAHSGAKILSMFKQYEWQIEGREGDLIVAQWTVLHAPDAADKSDYRTRIWFNPSKGMAPTRGQSLILPDGDKDWVAIWEFTSEEWSEVRPGLWLPGKFTSQSRLVQPGKAALVDDHLVAEVKYSE